MRAITDAAELQRLLAKWLGYIYSDLSGTGAGGVRFNILHRASCASLAMADLRFAKYVADDLNEAVAWLDANRRNNWKRCPICAPHPARAPLWYNEALPREIVASTRPHTSGGAVRRAGPCAGRNPRAGPRPSSPSPGW